MRDLRDDADGAGQAGAAERRRDAHRQRRRRIVGAKTIAEPRPQT